MGRPHQISIQPHVWLGGLEPVLKSSNGAAVLDIGCHNGAVLRAFAENGAKVLHGADIWEEGLSEARKISRDDSRFTYGHVDFRNGFQEVEKSIPILPNYDVVLYCAVHQHLVRQMGEDEAEKFAQKCFERSTSRIIFRGPTDRISKLGHYLTNLGFAEEYQYVVSEKGGVHVWKRG